MKDVFLDTDVLLDFLYERKPFFPAAVCLMALVETGQVRAHVSALILWNLAYLLEKEFGRTEGRRLLQEIRALLGVVSVDARIIDRALQSDRKDFEDAVQYEAARAARLKWLITRNTKDYPANGPLTLRTPEEFLVLQRTKP